MHVGVIGNVLEQVVDRVRGFQQWKMGGTGNGVNGRGLTPFLLQIPIVLDS